MKLSEKLGVVNVIIGDSNILLYEKGKRWARIVMLIVVWKKRKNSGLELNYRCLSSAKYFSSLLL